MSKAKFGWVEKQDQNKVSIICIQNLATLAGILVLGILYWILLLSYFCVGQTVLGGICWAVLYMLHSVGQLKIYSVGHLNNGMCWA